MQMMYDATARNDFIKEAILLQSTYTIDEVQNYFKTSNGASVWKQKKNKKWL